MENSLAYELLQELKHAYKRLFIITIILMAIIISMFAGFLIYESQFDYLTTTEQEQEINDIDSSEITQTIN